MTTPNETNKDTGGAEICPACVHRLHTEFNLISHPYEKGYNDGIKANDHIIESLLNRVDSLEKSRYSQVKRLDELEHSQEVDRLNWESVNTTQDDALEVLNQVERKIDTIGETLATNCEDRLIIKKSLLDVKVMQEDDHKDLKVVFNDLRQIRKNACIELEKQTELDTKFKQKLDVLGEEANEIVEQFAQKFIIIEDKLNHLSP